MAHYLSLTRVQGWQNLFIILLRPLVTDGPFRMLSRTSGFRGKYSMCYGNLRGRTKII